MSTRGVILVVEDEPDIRRGLCDALAFAGFETLGAADGAAAVELAVESPVDLVLLDVMLPKLNGFAALEKIRDVRPTLPVIIVTARGAEDDRIRGLRDGADDYVVKPFSPKELIARVEAVLRRSPGRAGDVGAIRFDGREICLRRRVARTSDGATQALSERDVDVLRYLAAHRTRAVDRDELLHHVWGLDPRGLKTRTVDMQIARLREAIGDHGAGPQLIETVRAKGYMIAEGAEIE